MQQKDLNKLKFPIRLLISARDPAAALQMTAICAAAASDQRFLLTVVAQSPAAEILNEAGISVLHQPLILTGAIESNATYDLLRLADKLLERHQPDVILCGLSSPGEAGIDEALMSQRKVPGLLLQDFWGEQNNFFSTSPDLVLVLDAEAAHQTRNRHGSRTRITGSPRHSTYANFDIAGTRNQIRAAIGIQEQDCGTVLGLFGQPLHAFDGYRKTLETLVTSVRNLAQPVTILYRPHPRETIEGKVWTQRWLQQSGIPMKTFDTGTTEEALSACDTVCTVLSNCAYDAAYMNYFSLQPLVMPLLLLFNDELRAFYAKTIDINRLPYIEQGLAAAVWNAADMGSALETSTHRKSRIAVWTAAKKLLPDPSKAIDEVFDALLESAIVPPKPDR
jgi:hypothetical protein